MACWLTTTLTQEELIMKKLVALVRHFGARRRGTARISMLAIVVVLIAPRLAFSTTFLVNSTDDRIDANPGNGSCDTGRLIIVNGQPEPECTLRAAIMEANRNLLPLPDTII